MKLSHKFWRLAINFLPELYLQSDNNDNEYIDNGDF